MDSGAGIGDLALNPFIGPAVVVDVRGRGSIDRELVDAILRAPGVERILFRTGAWGKAGQFPERFPAVDPAAVESLRAAKVQLIGTDAPSVDPFDSTDLLAHHALFGAGIAILENLLLDEVPDGEYELIALPLKIMGLDGSPVRAVLRSR
jgi:arylformamidase